ncbi:transcriptional regulator ATRX homolog [Bradysia coprophila]|nr:transcriptional regulator ATRX homolog [Bradysia coprophila]
MKSVTQLNKSLIEDNDVLKNKLKQSEAEKEEMMREKTSFNNRLKLLLNDVIVDDVESQNNKRPNDTSLDDEDNPARKHQKTVDEQPRPLNPTNETNDQNFTGNAVVELQQLQSVTDIPILQANDKNEMIVTVDNTNAAVTKDEPVSVTENNHLLSTENQVEERRKTMRRNIKKIMDFECLTVETKRAFQQEKERKLHYTQKLQKFCEEYGVLPGEFNKLDKLVLDFDANTKRERLSVDRRLLTKLKPHQCEGVKFMWDACFESIEKLQHSNGGGCILGHCMGLGKTLQVITLVHTLITHFTETKVKKVLILCPKSVILNWMDEFELWLKDFQNKGNINTYCLSSARESAKRIKAWQKNGGVFIIGYRSFQRESCKADEKSIFHQAFVDPGVDLVVCDEGHLLKNPASKLSLAINKIRTSRRIILTGSPLQNNLNEYFTMIEFVKPRLLGTAKEFNNRFVRPIVNGQFIDSTDEDITLMKYRAYILHKLLDGCVQRRDYSVLAEFLPPKQEYVLFIRLTKVQIDLYKLYMTTYGKNNPIVHSPQLKKICNHPNTLIDFAKRHRPAQRNSDSDSSDSEPNEIADNWWMPMFDGCDQPDVSGKMLLLFSILSECETRGEKLLLFSGSLSTLNVIEGFLATNSKGIWTRGMDYLRIDGSDTVDKRKRAMQVFNDETNKRARLFLISTKAGSLGVNLTGANRVIIFDASWNPSDDIQSIFRTYRFGQKKECYVYRFISLGTMEEKIYDRQVSKLSIAKRVIDEHQIGRYYKEVDLQQLFGVDDLDPQVVQHTAPIPSNDNLLNALLETHGDLIYKYHDHDSLLVDMKDETLTDQEIGDVWNEFESTGIDDFEDTSTDQDIEDSSE